VFAGGGAIAWLLLLEDDEEEEEDEEEEDEEVLEPHGSIATVWVKVLGGIMISFEPGGIALLPDCTAAASEHEVTARVSGLCCLGITTVRTPGLCKAALTGSWLELELELPPLLLLPQPATAATAAHVIKAETDRVRAAQLIFIDSSELAWTSQSSLVRPCAHEPPATLVLPQPRLSVTAPAASPATSPLPLCRLEI
jgi:hypothetical protein